MWIFKRIALHKRHRPFTYKPLLRISVILNKTAAACGHHIRENAVSNTFPSKVYQNMDSTIKLQRFGKSGAAYLFVVQLNKWAIRTQSNPPEIQFSFFVRHY